MDLSKYKGEVSMKKIIGLAFVLFAAAGFVFAGGGGDQPDPEGPIEITMMDI